MKKKREQNENENLFDREDAGTTETIQQITNAYESGAIGERPEQVEEEQDRS